MKPSKAIIVGIDFSASSPFVMRQAAHIGRLHGLPVIAVHVVNSSVFYHWNRGEDEDGRLVYLIAEARARLERFVMTETADEQITCEVASGKPGEELSRLVKYYDASLLIIAANDMTKARLGSISSSCVRTVPCDVLIARNWQSGNFRKICVCTDFSMASGKVIERAVKLAEANNSEMEVVHVIYPPARDYWGEAIEEESNDSITYAERVRKRANDEMARTLGRVDKLII